MTPFDKRLYDFWEKEDPKLWRRCYPRCYEGIGEFESPRFVAFAIASAIMWMETNKATIPTPTAALACVASRAFDYDLPAFFVSREFFADIAHTDLPDDLKWTETDLPYDAGLLYLPTGVMRDPGGKSVNVLAWWRARKGEQILVGKKTKIDCPEDRFTVVAICESKSKCAYSHAVDRTQTEYIAAPTVNLDYPARSIFDLPITQSDRQFLSQITALCFSLLLVQVTNPELVTPGRRNGKQSKKGRREFWSPNFIGRGYRVRREHQGGTHTSPRTHWRRGRWTHTPIGRVKNNPDFISVETLPHFVDGRIDWSSVDDATREKFWRCHKRQRIKPVLLIEGEAN